MPIAVNLNENLHLAGALLAASAWPEYEQRHKPYKPHRVAEQAHRYFAVPGAQLAAQYALAIAGEGAGLPRLYEHALNGNWPGEMAEALNDFAAAAPLPAFEAETAADWQQAEDDLRTVQGRADLAAFLAELFELGERTLKLAPNLLFPGQQCVTVSAPGTVTVCVPPPLAWGASTPWRYSERPDEVQAMTAAAFAQFFSATQLPELNAEAVGVAAAVLFLRQAEGEAAGNQFMVIQKKTRRWPGFPGIVQALAEMRDGIKTGAYANLAAGQTILSAALEKLI